MGGRREVSFIFYRPVTRSDLKHKRSFFRESVSTFLQLVVVACDFILFMSDEQPAVIYRREASRS